MLKMVIFDMDGTLIHNRIPFEEMRNNIAKRLNVDPESLKPLYEKLKEMNRPEVLEWLKEEEIRRADVSYPDPGLTSVLEYIRNRKIVVAVLTRNCREAARKALGWYLGMIDVLITRDDGYELKPSPEPIISLMNRFGFNPRDVLVVGDYDYDIQAGMLAGCKTVRIGAGFADYNIIHLEELKTIIKKLAEGY